MSWQLGHPPMAGEAVGSGGLRVRGHSVPHLALSVCGPFPAHSSDTFLQRSECRPRRAVPCRRSASACVWVAHSVSPRPTAQACASFRPHCINGTGTSRLGAGHLQPPCAHHGGLTEPSTCGLRERSLASGQSSESLPGFLLVGFYLFLNYGRR